MKKKNVEDEKSKFSRLRENRRRQLFPRKNFANFFFISSPSKSDFGSEDAAAAAHVASSLEMGRTWARARNIC